MNERIQDLTSDELQETINLYKTLEKNTIAKIIVDIYEKELNERANKEHSAEGDC